MPIYYPDILDQRTAARTFTYGDKDVMLYALGIGLGADPMNEDELPFVKARRPFGRITIANTDAVGICLTQAAFDQAYRAVSELDKRPMAYWNRS